MNAHLASARTPSPASLFMSSGAVSRYFFTAGAGAGAGHRQIRYSAFGEPFYFAFSRARCEMQSPPRLYCISASYAKNGK
jgi:hypothetical protein